MKTQIDLDSNFAKSANEDNGTVSGVRVLSLIPAFGMLIAVTIFVFYDCHAFETGLQCLWAVVKTFQKLKGRQRRSCEVAVMLECKENSLTNEDENILCTFCSQQVSKTSDDLLRHMIEIHAEHFFS